MEPGYDQWSLELFVENVMKQRGNRLKLKAIGNERQKFERKER